MSKTGDAERPSAPRTDGLTLQAVIGASRRLDELSTARLVGAAAEAVHKLQKSGQAVGTLAPGAIVVGVSGEVSLALPAWSSAGYTAPERLRGSAGDRRSDVFSLGVLLWEALAHERLFDGATDDAIRAAVLAGEVRPASTSNANVPAELDAICKKALARDPADRYQSAKVMAAEIAAVLDDAGYPDSNEQLAEYVAGALAAAAAPAAPPAPAPAPAAPVVAAPRAGTSPPVTTGVGRTTTIGLAPSREPAKPVEPAVVEKVEKADKKKDKKGKKSGPARAVAPVKAAAEASTAGSGSGSGAPPAASATSAHGSAESSAAAPGAASASRSAESSVAASGAASERSAESSAVASTPTGATSTPSANRSAESNAAAATAASRANTPTMPPASADPRAKSPTPAPPGGAPTADAARGKPPTVPPASADAGRGKPPTVPPPPSAVDAAWTGTFTPVPGSVVAPAGLPAEAPRTKPPTPAPEVVDSRSHKAITEEEARTRTPTPAPPVADALPAWVRTAVGNAGATETLPGMPEPVRPAAPASAAPVAASEPRISTGTIVGYAPVAAAPASPRDTIPDARFVLDTVLDAPRMAEPMVLGPIPGGTAGPAETPSPAQTAILGSGATAPTGRPPAADEAARLVSQQWNDAPSVQPSPLRPSISTAETVPTRALAGQTPAAGAAVVSGAIPTARAGSHSEAGSGPHPASVVVLPRAKSRGDQSKGDMLGGWGWSTDAHEAYDDDAHADVGRASRKRLLFAVGGAVAAVLLITVIALAGGSKSKPTEPAKPATQGSGAWSTPPSAPSPTATPIEPEPAPAPGTGSAAVDPASGGSAGSAAAGSASSSVEPGAVDPAQAAAGSAEPPPSDPKTEAAKAAAAKANAAEAAKAEAAKAAAAKADAAEAAKAEAAKAAAAKAEAIEAAKAEAARAAAAKAEAAKTAKAEAAKAAAAKAEAQKAEAARAAAAKAEAQKAEAARAAAARAEAQKAAAAKAEAQKTEAARAAAAKRVAARPDATNPLPPAKRPVTPATPPPAVRKPDKPKVDPAAPVDPYAPVAAEPRKVDPATAYRNGLQQFARGDNNGALETFRASLAANPGYAPTWRGIGLVYEKLGRTAQARTAYQRYLQLAPGASDADQIRDRLGRLP